MLMTEFIDMLVNEDHVNNAIVPYLSAQVLTHVVIESLNHSLIYLG